jgi:uncharacterized protein YndB with AHSA1/START domain
MPADFQPDPKLDLVLDRVVDIAPEKVWAAWTRPELLKQWFTPAPWQTLECEIDLRPGGRFHTVMRGPEGPAFSNTGCYLEIVPNRKLVWTGALVAGYRPQANVGALPFLLTAIIALTPEGGGTRYHVNALHGDEAACRKHAQMGFVDGWGKALDQLVALMKRA